MKIAIESDILINNNHSVKLYKTKEQKSIKKKNKSKI